jgi:hypothetical protein
MTKKDIFNSILVSAIILCIASCAKSAKKELSPRDKEIEELTVLANKGDSVAQYHLGRMYEYGGNYNEAFVWIEKSAMSGFDSAQVAISKYYLNVPHKRNVVVSLTYCRNAAAQGNAYAQYDLASRYEKGEIAPLDTERSWVLYKIAAENNEAHAQYKLGLILLDISNHPSKADSIAVDWITKAAKRGLPEAEHRLGRLYLQGVGVQKNRETAIDWITKSAEHGYASAQFLMGFLAKTDEEAEPWYSKASEQNLAVAQMYLGILKKWHGDLDKANELFKLACENGCTEAEDFINSNITGILYDTDKDGLPNFKYEGEDDCVYLSKGVNKDKIKEFLFSDGIDPNCYDEYGLSDFKR